MSDSAANGPLTGPGSKSQPHGQGQVRGSSALPGSVSDSAASVRDTRPPMVNAAPLALDRADKAAYKRWHRATYGPWPSDDKSLYR